MARKNLLIGLTDVELPAGNSTDPFAGEPARTQAPHLGVMSTRGAIGAVSRSIENIKAQSIVDLDPVLIDPSFITDRLESAPQMHEALVASIREHGQQVPILVRPHPEKDGRYQIAYGRRRLRAIVELGVRVRAIVKPLSDPQLVVAQGQENSARTDLSFIERALFASRLEQGGYSRDVIMAALSVDKTGLSRLISAAVKIPQDLIEAIGSAPKAGRDRWTELSRRLENAASLNRARAALNADDFRLRSSDERFDLVLNAVKPKRAKSPSLKVWKDDEGTRVAQIKDDPRHITLAISKKTAEGFGVYLVDRLPEIYAEFKRRGDE